MGDMIKIAVDAMGGDNAPNAIVEGAVLSLENKRISIILVGNEMLITDELKRHNYDKSRISIINTTEVIGSEEVPTVAIKKKKDSSMVVGLKLVKNNEAESFVSAGNTGALLTGSTVIIGRIKGIERPALGTILPNKKSFSFLIDSGANVDSKATYLLQFAKMGSVYMESIMDIKSPTVGLVNIGVEKEKGNLLTKEAYTLLEESDLNFTGNVEARDIPYGTVDVLVCDAFVGNTILKFAEGFSKALLSMIKDEMLKKTIYKIGAYLSKNAFSNLKKKFDYDDIGGAPFLGLNALVIKAHGSSNARAIKNAINQCVIAYDNDLVNKIKEKL